MARPRSSSPSASPATGPYLQTAVVCERVLNEQDGVLSLIRIVDRIVQSAVGPDPPEEMPPVSINLSMVVVLKSGEARGSHPVYIALEAPSGQEMGEQQLQVLLEGEGDRGVNLVVNLAFQAEMPGLYWFSTYFGDDRILLTRTPLRVVYQPQRIGVGPSSPAA